jgi:CcmD family protein
MRKRSRVTRYAGLIAVVAMLGCATAGLHASWRQPGVQTEAAREGYVPVKDLPAAEQLPATPLVLGAYAVIWIGVFVYVWSVSRRLASVDRELSALRRMIETRQ